MLPLAGKPSHHGQPLSSNVRQRGHSAPHALETSAHAAKQGRSSQVSFRATANELPTSIVAFLLPRGGRRSSVSSLAPSRPLAGQGRCSYDRHLRSRQKAGMASVSLSGPAWATACPLRGHPPAGWPCPLRRHRRRPGQPAACLTLRSTRPPAACHLGRAALCAYHAPHGQGATPPGSRYLKR